MTSCRTDFNKGLIRPSLIRQLQSILEQYPDDGQILKELIQNAEDAGAKRVVFMLDNTCFPDRVDRLYDKGMQQYQGPALYVYNDAVFTDDDWRGIRMLNDSVKDKDPMKVGRFGLGFKSVFHMTDLPSLFSGHGIGFLDPHELLFRDESDDRYPSSSHMWDLVADQEEISRLEDQFAPFVQGLFGATKQAMSEERNFNGTMFRFPFRMEGMKSKLCSTLYSAQQVRNLFSSLEIDAHIMLLFLRNLEVIEVYEKSSLMENPVKLMTIRIAPEVEGTVRSKRQELIKEIELRRSGDKSDAISVTYAVTTELTKWLENPVISKQHWIVSQYYGSRSDVPSDICSTLGLLPWGALAISTEPSRNIPRYLIKPCGHIFCFLPLPLEQESPTGLRVHVHGYFAVDQNRRHLKTRSAEQVGENVTDKSLLWNEYLIGNLLPKALGKLVLYLVTNCSQNDDNSITHDLIYSLIPDLNLIKPQWKPLAATFLKELHQLAIFYSPASGGRFVQMKSTLFDNIEDTSSLTLLIRHVIHQNNTDLVSVPGFFLKQQGSAAQRVTPRTLCAALKNTKTHLQLSNEDRTALLEYVVNNLEPNLADIVGTKLLPTADGSWIEFKPPNVGGKIYVDSSDHRSTLLPGLDHYFIHPDAIHTCKTLISTNLTQLVYLDQNTVADMLTQHLFPASLQSLHEINIDNYRGLSDEWLVELWQYLGCHFPHDLSRFHNIHIIPIGNSKLVQLNMTTAIIVSCYGTIRLPDEIKSVCEHVGLTVVDSVPTAVTNHPSVIGKYVLRSDALGVVNALSRLKSDAVVSSFQTLSNQDKKAFQNFIVNGVLANSEVMRYGASLLRVLPVFQTLEGSGFKPSTFVSLKDVNRVAPACPFPVDLPQQLLDASNTPIQQVLNKLGIKPLTLQETLTSLVFPAIISSQVKSHEQTYSDNQVVQLMQFVCGRWSEFDSIPVVEKIKQIRFVRKKNGDLVRASELFDLHNETLAKLFQGEDMFPCDSFAEPRFSYILSKIGIKGLNAVTAADIWQIAKKLNTTSNPDMSCAHELLSHLEKYTNLLSNMLFTDKGQESLLKVLQTLKWVPVSKSRPERYPHTLKFAADEVAGSLASPLEVCSLAQCYLRGSVKLVIDRPVTQIPKLAQQFGWELEPKMTDVVQHLLNIVSVYTTEHRIDLEFILDTCYRYLNNHSNQFSEVAYLFQDKEWILHSDGFSVVTKVVKNKPFIDLQPHVYVLSRTMKHWTSLWNTIGIKDNCVLADVLIGIKEYHTSQTRSKDEIKRDLQLAVNILNEVASLNNNKQLRDDLLIPVQAPDETFRMMPIDDCTYCDKEWFQRGLDEYNVLEEGDIHLVNSLVPTSTCEALNIHSIVSRMLNAEELDIGFRSYGQSEPLTRRLNNILQDYTDGLSVLKELIQNADDAGANEVKFLYDERPNEDAQIKLIDRGMKELQGPALWAYNDATFSNNDFDNLVKLSGATKEQCKDKIGRFGLGFNAVYNLTDVPSLVSQNYIVFLDPHTTFLNKAIRDKSKPGIKMDLSKKSRQFQCLSDQFKPFNDIFGCSFKAEQTSYQGTLFRFPLRTKLQSEKSEICKKCYDRSEMNDLLSLLGQSAHHLLLFTQNVCKITVYHMSPDKTSPTDMVELMSINKSVERVVRSLDSNTGSSQNCAILRHADRLLKSLQCHKSIKLESSLLMKMTASYANASESMSIFSGSLSGDSYWLVSSCLGQGESFEMAQKEHDLMSIGGVAARLEKHGEKFKVVSLMNNDKVKVESGILFCFLPLPITKPTSLPVHVNGFFAVTSSRMHLFETVIYDKTERRAVWNELLMRDAVKLSYANLMEDVLKVCPDNDPYAIWPVHKATKDAGIISQLTDSLYHSICSDGGPEVVLENGKYISVRNCKILEISFRESKIGDVAQNVFRHVKTDDFAVIDLPSGLLVSMLQTSAKPDLEALLVSRQEFYEKWFLPNIVKVSTSLRDELVIDGLFDDKVCHLLCNYECIPVLPNGVLRKPCDLIDPSAKIAILFENDDKRFPMVKGLCTAIKIEDVYRRLIDLGMKHNDLSWEEIADRCSVVTSSRKLALKRLKTLVELMSSKSGCISESDQQYVNVIRQMHFLPVLKKPDNFPLKWKGDETGEYTSCDEAYLSSVKSLVCCSFPVVDEYKVFGVEHFDLRTILHLHEKEVCPETVLGQLDCILKLTDDKGTINRKLTKGLLHISEMCERIYSFFNKQVKDQKGLNAIDKLMTKRCIFLGNKFMFMNPADCARSLVVGDSLLPYLSLVPDMLSRNHDALLTALHVKDGFSALDFIKLLERMHEKYDNTPLPEEDFNVAITVTNSCLTHFETLPPGVRIYVPNTNGILFDVEVLCFNNCQWIEIDDMNICHHRIPFESARRLGVKTIKQEYFVNNSVGLPFGQKEKLITRLRKILAEYPSDESILKEMLQNADDAGATEIHFINDMRTLRRDRVFEDKWKPLQGPALCIYNNKPFTNADIKGIQNLGEGSKGDDPTKTGKFGVGFNCVYHVTDVPTFLTHVDGEKVFCAFDPNCKYVPGATQENPGRMLNNIPSMKVKFSDVFAGYYEEVYGDLGATLFRLPLRHEASELAKNVLTSSDVTELFHKFHGVMYESLLFLNSVEHIELKTTTGEAEASPVTEYAVNAEISSESKRKRDLFTCNVKSTVHRLKDKEISFQEVGLEEVVYELITKDSEGMVDEWMIVQRFGFENASCVPRRISAAYQNGDIGLLPRAGVAYLKKTNRRPTDVCQHQNRLFCFLPLPLPSALPVHINGHFSLDHEARRNLWFDETGGCRTEWNFWLMEHVVAPAYCTLIQKLQKHLTSQTDADISRCHRYFEIFPNVKEDTKNYIDKMCTAVYQNLQRLPILPVHITGNSGERKLSDWMCPVSENSDFEAFFDDLHGHFSAGRSVPSGIVTTRNYEVVRNILVRCGFRLFICPMSVCRNFQKAAVAVKIVSPEAVLQFFATFQKQNSPCLVQKVDVPIGDTLLKDVTELEVLLKYCAEAPNYKVQLDGLPLLVTCDNYLRAFTSVSAKYGPEYCDILPHVPQLFLHHRVLYALKLNSKTDPRLCKSLTVEDFVEHLPELLPRDTFCGADKRVTLAECLKCLKTKSTACDKWIGRVWTFLGSFVTSQQFIQILVPLMEWCLLPAVYGHEEMLIPIQRSPGILLFNRSLFSRPLEDLLSRFGIPQPSFKHTDCVNKMELYMKSLGTLEKPASVVAALEEILHYGPPLQGRLLHSDCLKLLRYLSQHLSALQSIPNSIPTIQKLPCFCRVDNLLVSIYSRRVYVVPRDIPTIDMDHWTASVCEVFIKSEPDCDELLTYLGCVVKTDIELYCSFIFKHFEMLSEMGRYIHLRYVRDTLLIRLNDVLRESLISLKFISRDDGTLCEASEFYDHNIKVFLTMHDKSAFVPEPFKQREWWKFLHECGLISDVTQNMFVEYAHRVAASGQKEISDTVNEQSMALVQHLFTRDDITDSKFLKHLKHIAFIVPHSVGSIKESFYPQFGKRSEQGHLLLVPFAGSIGSSWADTIWTVQNIIPLSAIPDACTSKRVMNDMSKKEYVYKQLKIDKTPKLHNIAQHTQQLCSKMALIKDEHAVDILSSVLMSIYKTLQSNLPLPCTVTGVLSLTPCVIDVEKHYLVRPGQTVLRIAVEDEIIPYLVHMPDDLGQFKALFKALGATESPTIDQYTMVLRLIFESSQGKEIHFNERNAVSKALKKFFDHLKATVGKVELTEQLYLPGTDRKMHKSSDMVFNNLNRRNPFKDFDQPVLSPLEDYGIEISCHKTEEFIKRLPADQQPALLSVTVQEVMSDQYQTTESELATRMQEKFHSDDFRDAVVRLVLHNMKSDPSDYNEKLQRAEKYAEDLKAVKFVGVSGLATYMVHKGQRIPNTETRKLFHIQVEKNQWVVYVSEEMHVTKYIYIFYAKLANVICAVLNNIAMPDRHCLMALLQGRTDEAHSILDEMAIIRHEKQSTDDSVLPIPGMYVPLYFHGLLKQEVLFLRPGDFAALEIEDPTEVQEPGQAVYILVQIIDQVQASSTYAAGAMYKIKVKPGEERIVSAPSLYAFVRDALPDVSESSSVTDSSSGALLDYDEITSALKDVLKDAWMMLTSDRNKLVKRLIRRWHPDKNMDIQELSTRVTQFILMTADRLDRGLTIDGDDETRPSSPAQYSHCSAPTGTSSGSHFGHAFFNYMSEQTKHHQQQQQKYRENYAANTSDVDRKKIQHFTDILSERSRLYQYYRNYTTRHNKWQFFDYFYVGRNPQPGEGRRWLKQAKFDIDAAKNDEGCGRCGAFEWACYKYYQAAVNALRGAQYALDANKSFDLHDVRQLTRGLPDTIVHPWACELHRLVKSTDQMLYPTQHGSISVPRDTYTETTGLSACKLSTDIVDWCETYVQSVNGI